MNAHERHTYERLADKLVTPTRFGGESMSIERFMLGIEIATGRIKATDHTHNFTWKPGQSGYGRCDCGAEAPFPIAPMTTI